METSTPLIMETSSEKNTATFTHLSTLTQYFIPFGNYIFPILIWSSYKDKSEFANHHGKQALNFQLSLLLYTLILVLIAIPIFVIVFLQNIPMEAVFNDEDFVIRNFNFDGNIGLLSIGATAVLLFGLLKIVEFFLVIYASIKASNGEYYKYPMTISFIK
ncbi:putative Tic20 family protein [Flavobacterium sp. 1355]|nr:putative Tic20 family protein [Flavobacterium sp. 1355]